MRGRPEKCSGQQKLFVWEYYFFLCHFSIYSHYQQSVNEQASEGQKWIFIIHIHTHSINSTVALSAGRLRVREEKEGMNGEHKRINFHLNWNDKCWWLKKSSLSSVLYRSIRACTLIAWMNFGLYLSRSLLFDSRVFATSTAVQLMTKQSIDSCRPFMCSFLSAPIPGSS